MVRDRLKPYKSHLGWYLVWWERTDLVRRYRKALVQAEMVGDMYGEDFVVNSMSMMDSVRSILDTPH